VPEVLAPAEARITATSGYKTSGRRTALARWLTDPSNPLTTRVQVNRIWRHHFGRGLVTTVANFGRSGTGPIHPELLDWLAAEFIRVGHSQKALHRLIVTSTVYRQSSGIDAVRTATDPENALYGAWQPRRHEGEVLRDSMLAVSGKLHGPMFGPPVPVAAQPDGSVVTNDDPQGNRRSIYVMVRRSEHLTMLDLFDTPMMEINCPERGTSIVPLQALALLHGPFAERTAQALAERIIGAGTEDEERIEFAWRLLFARDPRPRELHVIREFLNAIAHEQLGQASASGGVADHAAAHRDAWTHVALVLLNSNEFVFVH
jgi:hypothetical protein